MNNVRWDPFGSIESAFSRDVHITVDIGMLTITGERKQKEEEKKAKEIEVQ